MDSWVGELRLHEVEGSPGGLFWDELSESAPRFNFSMDMSPVCRISAPGDALGLKVPVATALGMSLRSSRTQVATSMFICLAR